MTQQLQTPDQTGGGTDGQPTGWRGGRATADPTDTERTTTRGAWLLVARRELAVKLTDRAFLVGTLITLLIIVGSLGASALLENRTSTYAVAATSADGVTLVERLAERAPGLDAKVKVELVREPGDSSARAAVQAEEVDAWLHQSGDGWSLTTRGSAPDGLSAVVETVVRDEALAANARAVGSTVEALQRGSAVALEQLDGNAQRSQLNEILGFAFAFLFYMAALMFGITLANSVVEEKQSRIVEMIAAAIPLRQLLAGKVVGNTALAVGQMALYVGVGLVGLGFTEFSGLLPALSGAVVWFLVFFLAGFVALSCLWAVAGSLASRNEDLQSTSTPVTMLVMLMFFGGLLLDGPYQTVASFVPPLSAIIMPVRLLDGGVAWWEPVLAMALLLAFAAAMILAGERIYRRSLLQSGGRLSLKDAWRLEE